MARLCPKWLGLSPFLCCVLSSSSGLSPCCAPAKLGWFGLGLLSICSRPGIAGKWDSPLGPLLLVVGLGFGPRLLIEPWPCPRGMLASLCKLDWASSSPSLVLLWAKVCFIISCSFLLFLAHYGMFSYIPCKTSETPKLVEYISWKPYSLSFVCVLYDSWQYKLCNKDRQQALPHLALCSSLSKGMKD
jgi:hypothetical protein